MPRSYRESDRIEQQTERALEIEARKKEVRPLLNFLAGEARGAGLDVDENARLFSSVEDEVKILNRRAEREMKDTELGVDPASRLMKSGELGEVVIVSLLSRALSKRFIVVRSSVYDDEINKVDTLLINKKNGKTICGVDVVVSETAGDTRALGKKRELENLNKRGAKLDYGVEKQVTGFETAPRKNLPVFVFALQKEDVEQALKKMSALDLRKDEPRDFEERLFFKELVLKNIEPQSRKLLKSENRGLFSAVRGQVAEFVRTLAEVFEERLPSVKDEETLQDLQSLIKDWRGLSSQVFAQQREAKHKRKTPLSERVKRGNVRRVVIEDDNAKKGFGREGLASGQKAPYGRVRRRK